MMHCAFNPEVEKQLSRLQLALTQDSVWRTSVSLLKAAMPLDALIGIRYYGGRPMLLRTTHPVPDETAYLNGLVEAGLWWGETGERVPAVDIRRLSDIRDGSSLDDWRHFQEFLKPHGWRHLAGLLFWGDDGDFLGELTLHRTASQGDFSDEELTLLRRLHPHIGASVARLVKLDRRQSGRTALEKVLRCLPLRVVIVNWHGKVACKVTDKKYSDYINWHHVWAAMYGEQPPDSGNFTWLNSGSSSGNNIFITP